MDKFFIVVDAYQKVKAAEEKAKAGDTTTTGTPTRCRNRPGTTRTPGHQGPAFVHFVAAWNAAVLVGAR